MLRVGFRFSVTDNGGGGAGLTAWVTELRLSEEDGKGGGGPGLAIGLFEFRFSDDGEGGGPGLIV